jgi:hypothetical protein
MATQTNESLHAVMAVQNSQLESRAGGTVWRYIPNGGITPMRANGAVWRFSPDQPPRMPVEARAHATVWQKGGVNHAK